MPATRVCQQFIDGFSYASSEMPSRHQQLTALAKLLHYALAHRPDEFGLVLDAAGWIPVKDLLRALSEEEGWGFLRLSHLEEVIHVHQPGHFLLEQNLIRAMEPAQLRSPAPVLPPPLLYKAITRKSYPVVAQYGLLPPVGRDNILATTPELAAKLGRRRDPKALVVTVQAQAAAAGGGEFFSYGPHLFLAGAIAPAYLQLPPPPREPVSSRPAKTGEPATLGSVLVDIQGKPVKPWQKERRRGPAWKEAARQQRRRHRSGK